ncbi:MAG: alpha/beta hydrolase [Bdellovibrionales bacterium]|nr:alpha/beta hydrolase [Bdellovibrionales bacterium]
MEQISKNIKRVIKKANSKEAIKVTIGVISKVNPHLAADLGLQAFLTPFSRRKKEHLFPEGTRVQRKKVANKKVVLYKYGNSPRKILLVHGWEGAGSDFSHFFKPLDEAGFEVWALDLPGHGFAPFSQLNVVQAATIIRGLEEKYGPFCAMVGHSFGAFSIGYAVSHFDELKDIPFVSIGAPNQLSKIIKSFVSIVGFNKNQHDYISRKIEKNFDIQISEFEQGKFFKIHQGPNLVVHDKEDKVVSEKVLVEFKKINADLDLLVTTGLGHNRILRDRKTISKIIEFLDRHKDLHADFNTARKFGLL